MRPDLEKIIDDLISEEEKRVVLKEKLVTIIKIHSLVS